MSINRWMDKEDVIYIHTGLLLCHEKEWNNAIFSNMDRQSQRKTNIWYHLYVESKKMIQMNLFTKHIQRHWKLTYGYQGGREEG